jgi:ABC-type amino acid transport substrate-binding protein
MSDWGIGRTGPPSANLKSEHLKSVLFLVLLALLSLAGCGNPSDPFLARVQEAGVLRVGLDPSWPPFEYVDPASGKVVGLDVDLARAIGRELGVEVAFVVSGWEGLYGALFAGQFDAILSALPYDPWRTKEALYSISYFNAGPVLVVRADSKVLASDVETRDLVHALAGHTVHAEFGAEGDVQARRLFDKGAEIEIMTHDTAAAALGALSDGVNGTEVALVDAVSARLYLRESADHAGLRIVGQPLYDEMYVIAVHPAAASLQAAIDQALVNLRESGELDALLDRWL